jgi:3-dehydroquinate synthase
MEKMIIRTASKTYPVWIGNNIIDQLPKIINETDLDITKILVITDETVANLYLDQVVEVLKSHFPIISYSVPAGEKAKSFQTFYDCQTFALENELDRKSLIIAFGGGVIGDLAGFVAATFMRGIPFIQVPTTLLAHDSAVGGKVAINHPLGKNMIGAFHQPEAVVYDINYLKTLPEKELRSGFAEVIKHAMIKDADFFQWLKKEIQTLNDLREEHLIAAIKKGISIKAEIVSEDEKESGVRSFLNFGHTLGHAIEAELGYGSITHGDAVALGMLFAVQMSEDLFSINLDYQSLQRWFKQLGYPVHILKQLEPMKLLKRMKKDKKAISGKVKFILLRSIGHVVIEELEDEWIIKKLHKLLVQ